MSETLAIRLYRIDDQCSKLRKEQQRLVRDSFPLGTVVTVTKNSRDGWKAEVIEHDTYGTDLVVKNVRTGNVQRVGISWIKEAQTQPEQPPATGLNADDEARR